MLDRQFIRAARSHFQWRMAIWVLPFSRYFILALLLALKASIVHHYIYFTALVSSDFADSMPHKGESNTFIMTINMVIINRTLVKSYLTVNKRWNTLWALGFWFYQTNMLTRSLYVASVMTFSGSLQRVIQVFGIPNSMCRCRFLLTYSFSVLRLAR